MTLKIRKNFRISQDAENLLELLASKLGQTETGIVELAIRRLAELEQIKSRD